MTDNSNYANADALVTTAWAAAHSDDPGIRVVEVDVDPTVYDRGHIANAIGWDWRRDLQDPIVRDIAGKEALESVLSRSGIRPDTTIVLYGDNNNWFAAYAYWALKYYGHDAVKLIDGGRVKWEQEQRPYTTDVPTPPVTSYGFPASTREELRAYRPRVEAGLGRVALVDVRSPGEFSGELLAPANLPQEGAQRGGHIPTAVNIPWGSAVRDDGTFRPVEELRQLYGEQGVVPEREVIAYCRIGERSAHTWYVLRELLGYPEVRNYDGSWTEWGSSIRVPIER